MQVTHKAHQNIRRQGQFIETGNGALYAPDNQRHRSLLPQYIRAETAHPRPLKCKVKLALCVEQLGKEHRNKYKDSLAGILLPLQEKDGSWFDYELYNYHQQYGTAFALMTLERCRKGAF